MTDTAPQGKVYAKAPDGSIVLIPSELQQDALNEGYSAPTPEEASGAHQYAIEQAGPDQAVSQGLLEAPEGSFSTLGAAKERALSTGSFGLLADKSPESRAQQMTFQREHPVGAFAADVVGSLPALAAVGAGVGAVTGAAAGAGLAARVGAVGLDWGANALVGGSQIEGQQSQMEGRDFSWTDAAVTGLAGEVLGRGVAHGAGAVFGAGKNLLAKAERQVVASDASASLAKGGLLNDYRVAQHAEAYHNELADLAARDLDELEPAFEEVSRQDRKRARIVRTVADQPEVQTPIREQAYAELSGLREALAGELQDGGAPARNLARQLDDRIAALEDASTGRKLWRLLDENRQALQEYRLDLHQAYEDNPGSAWLSRDGLAQLDAAEKSTREALLREDAWGADAAQMQAAYNVPFNEQYFPTVKTVRNQLMFSPYRNERGFNVFRGDPEKLRRFFTRDLAGPDGARLAEQFTDYLDGVSAIAKAGERDAPASARTVLEKVRRLRKATANARFVSEAAERTARRFDVAGVVVGAAAGGALGGPVGAAAGGAGFGAAARGARLGDWLMTVSERLGFGSGQAKSMAKLLEHDALPAAAGADRSVGSLLDDLVDRGPSEPPGGGGGGGAPPAPAGGGGGGLTESMRADAADGAWQPSVTPEPGVGGVGRGATMPDELAPEVAPESLRPGREARAAAPTTPVGPGPEVHRGQGEVMELEPIRDQAAARARDEARVAKLTKTEFADVVGQLRSSGTDEAEAFARELESREAELVDEGWLSDELEPSAPPARAATPPPAPAPAEDYAAGAGSPAAQARRAARQAARTAASAAAAATSPGGPAVKALAGLHPAIEIRNPERIAEAMTKVFKDSPPTTEQWRRLMPLDELQTIGKLHAGEGTPNPVVLERLRARGSDQAAIDKYIDRATNGYVHVLSLSPDEVSVSAYGPLGETAPFERRLADGTREQDPGGLVEEAWRISRTYLRRIDGTFEVHHNYLFIRDDLQATGVGARVLKSQMAEYIKMGVDLVTVDCAEVGKYFWPSIGFDGWRSQVESAVRAYQTWLIRKGHAADNAAAKAAVKGIHSLPGLAQAEYGKEFLLQVDGEWNSGLEMRLDESNPAYHLMRARLDIATAAVAGLGGAWEASRDDADKARGEEDGAAAAAVGGLALFGRRAGAFQAARAKLVRDVARKLFAGLAEPAVRSVARLAYSKAQIEQRQEEFHTWQANPQALVDRVADGARDAPSEAFAAISAGVYATAAFLKQKLPQNAKPSPIAIRALPVSSEAAAKYARYEQAALHPQDALHEAADAGYMSPELLETLQTLTPDLLAELRVQAYQTVRGGGPPLSIQAKAQYARLFDGDGATADPAFSAQTAEMVGLAYDQQVAPKPGPAGAGPQPGVSRVSSAVAAPRGLGPVV